MAESNQSPPLSQPPSPRTANDAIAVAHHGGETRSISRSAPSSVLFTSGDDEAHLPSPPITDINTPLPSQRKRPPSSSRTTSSKVLKSSKHAQTPASETNRSECMTTGFHLWSRENLYEASKAIASSDDDFERYEIQYSRQITYRFRLEHETKRKKRESLSSSTKRTRSTTSTTPVSSDQNAAALQTNNPRRLSRLHWEDILRCQSGHRLKLFVTKDAVNQTDSWWQDTFSSVVKELSLKPTHFNKGPMYCFDVSILEANLHNEIFKGDHSLSSLQRMFNQGDGFSIKFTGTKDTTLSVAWRKMLYSGSEIMFFDYYSNSDGDFICFCAAKYDDFLNEEMKSQDDWHRLCSVFLLMSNDYLLFVSSYRKCDSIMVEHLYDRFGPVWRCLGQSRYLERVWRQQEVLYTKFDHKALQTQRMTRFSRPYHGSTGKGAHAKDEKLELFNWEYSKYPKPRSKYSFMTRSKFVGVGKKSKATIQQFYSIKWGMKRKPPRSASTKFDKPQFNFVYEIFGKCGTSETITSRRMSKNYVSKYAKGMKTKLKLESVESRARCTIDDPSLALLSTLRQGIAPTVTTDANSTNEEMDPSDDDETQMMNEDDLRNVDETDVPNEEESVRLSNEKAGYNVQCLTDIWQVGSKKIISDSIKDKRANKKKRYDRSRQMMDEMGKLIENTRNLIETGGTLKEETGDYEQPDFMTTIDELNVFLK